MKNDIRDFLGCIAYIIILLYMYLICAPVFIIGGAFTALGHLIAFSPRSAWRAIKHTFSQLK